jgi:hypothetical protein
MVSGLLALSVAATGWYYLFHSRAALGLAGVEGDAINLLRARLRRVGGFFLLVLGVLFFAGFFAVDQEHPTPAYLAVWLGVFLVVLIILVLAMVDLRLTLRLRRSDQHHAI